MASTFDNDLRLEEMATGENAGSWGTKTNTNLELIADAFGYGTFTIADADTTLTMPDGSDTDNALRSLYLKISSSADLTTTRTLTLAPNTVSKLWYIENNTSGGQTITISQGSGANVSILNGQAKLIATDGAGAGAAVIDATQDLAIPDLFIDDDLSLQSDGAVINFGADADVSLTHVADTGLRLNAAMALEFRDGDLSINSSADGQLDINADSAVAFDTDTLYVDSTNDRVGINTTSPGAPLEVDGGSDIAFFDGTNVRLKIQNPDTGVLQLNSSGSGDSLSFATVDTEAMRVDSSQRVLIGYDSSVSVGSSTASIFQVNDNTAFTSVARYTAGTGGAILSLAHAKTNTIGGTTLVAVDDILGILKFVGADGTDLITAGAQITGEVDGTPGANDMPGRLSFWTTADGASAPTERMRITREGIFQLLGSTDNIIKSNSDSSRVRIFGGGTQSVGNGAALTLQGVDSSTGNYADLAAGSSGYVNFRIGTTNAMRIDSSQRVLIGSTESYGTINANPALQVHGLTYEKAMVGAYRYDNGAGSPAHFTMSKSRGTSVGTQTIVQSGDTIGQINFVGSDGTDFESLGNIAAQVDGSPANNDMPGRLVFSTTPDGSISPAERMRITNGGRVGINTASESGAPTAWLTIDNDINSADVLTNKSSYHISLGVDGANTDHYIGGIGFGDITQTTIQAAISAVDNGTSAATGIAFATGNTSAVYEAMRINSSQRVLIAQTDARNSFFNNNVGTYNPRFQVESSNSTSGIRMASFVHNDDANNAFCLILGKSGGTTPNSVSTIVQGHHMGILSFQGATGNALAEGARIQGVSDGAPGPSDMPGSIQFLTTPDGGSGVTERMRLNSSGYLSVGGAFSATDPLHVRKSSGTTIARFEHTGGDGNIVVEDSSGAEATMGIGGSGDDSYWGNGSQKGLWHYAAGSAPGSPSDAHAQMMIDRTMRVGSAPGTSNRSETLVFHLWESRNLDKVSGTAFQGGQSDTTGGTVIYRPSTAASNTMYFGPYGAFPAGSYTALHRMKVSDNTPTGNLIQLNISGSGVAGARGAGSYNQGTTTIQLSATDFDASNKYQYFAVDFEKDDNSANIEFRGLSFVTGKTNVYLDHILVVPRVNF